MFKILISDKLGQAGLDRLDEMPDVAYEMKTGLSQEELCAILPGYDALIVRSGTKVTAEVLAAGTNLVVVGRAGIGVDNVDIAAATRRGIIVMNTPAANSIATAEQTMALMLAASRHTAVGHESLRQGEWRRTEFVGTQLYDKTLGIIGFGRIGRLVAQRAIAFGMNVIAYDPYISEEVGREMGVLLVDLDDLLADSDYITLHTALLPETIKIINATTLKAMKDGVVLINCARGKLIDEDALLEALQKGKVKMAALDVYSSEPPLDNPLIGLPNVLHTPHLGASSIEAQRDVATQIVEQVVDALHGADFRNTINMPFQVSNFNEIRPYLDLSEKLGALHTGLADTPIQQVEIEVHGAAVSDLVRAVAAATLKGILQATRQQQGPLNYINAPLLAEEAGIKVTQTVGQAPVDYPNLISCRVRWADGERLLGGVLFGGSEPRLVRVDHYTLEARPEGVLLIMQNRDVPGVIGQIGTILAAYEVNIGEWRMGRDAPGGEALSVINLDSEPQPAVLDALERITAVTQAKLVVL
ncbi:MAG: phosphoglycerate dehydrogenase [Chloroflexota bacterium]|jgi:D-3-phosphoglycerate dehydrogenase / 2-oxoglutarate reductase